MKAVFLDLFGTLVEEQGYEELCKEKIKLVWRASEILKKLKEKNYKIIIVSNQAGINKGYISKKEFEEMLDIVKKRLKKKNVEIDKIYYCPHTEEDKCECRKPRIGMLEKAINEFGIEIEDSWMIGDKTSDIKIKDSLYEKYKKNIKTILLKTGWAGKDKRYNTEPDHISKNLYGAFLFVCAYDNIIEKINREKAKEK